MMSTISTVKFRDAIVQHALHYVGKVHEIGFNHGTIIDHYLRCAGLENPRPPLRGYPYCAAGVTTWGMEAVETSTNGRENFTDVSAIREYLKENYFYPSAAVAEIWNDAKERGRAVGRHMAVPSGYLIVFHFPTGNHIGVVYQPHSNGMYWTIEANTGPGRSVDLDGRGEREGDGVYVKRRDLTFVVGFIRTDNFVNGKWS